MLVLTFFIPVKPFHDVTIVTTVMTCLAEGEDRVKGF